MSIKLNCRNIEQRIHQLLDDRLTLTGDPLLMKHAETCETCFQLIIDYDEMSTVSSRLSFLPGSSLDDWSNAAPVSEATNQRQFSPQHLGLLASIAAALAFVLGMFSLPNGDLSPQAGLHSEPFQTSQSADHGALALSIASQSQTDHDQTPNTVTYAKANGSEEQFIRQLVFFQPPTLVELAQNTPTFVNSVKLPSTSSWQQISDQLDPINPYLQFSAELPGIRNFQSSVSVTIKLLSRSLAKPEDAEPNLGWFPEQKLYVTI